MYLRKKYSFYIVCLAIFCQCLTAGLIAAPLEEAESAFVIKPYLQLGNHPLTGKEEGLEFLWASSGNQDKWSLAIKGRHNNQWQEQSLPNCSVISYSVPDRIYLFSNNVTGLEPGETFEYRLKKNGQEVFAGKGTARKGKEQSYRFALFGDTGANTASEKKIVYQTYEHSPDFLVIAGDIVYNFGRLSEYLEKFFPVFSHNKASAEEGAPLLQSVLTFAVIGNHDIGYGANKKGVDFDIMRDGLAFYQLWSEPLNGPVTNRSGHNMPKLLGSSENIKKYLQSTGSRYPQMSNYSFDYGNSHWLILDANPYMDWTNKKLRDWVRNDLHTAHAQTWKFVCFHQPGFSVDKVHCCEQRMRLLSDIFQENNVDVVFSGHAHNYQRTFPLTFNGRIQSGVPIIDKDGTVPGDFILDKEFDGEKNIHPHGVVYIVSGGGGAALYGEFDPNKAKHQLPVEAAIAQKTFTDKFDSSTHSFTLCDVNNRKLVLKQISENGSTIDHFVIDKNM